MSQVNWKKYPNQYIKRPFTDPKGVRVSPKLVVAPAVLNILKKIDALGFSISNYWDVVSLMKMQADPSLLGAIEDMTQEEYQLVYTTLIKGTPPSSNPIAKVSMSILGNTSHLTMHTLIAQAENIDEFKELLQLLLEAGFDMSKPQIAYLVLIILGRSNSPFASLAQRLSTVARDPTAWGNAIINNWHLIEPHAPTPDELTYNPVMEKQYFPSSDPGKMDEHEESELDPATEEDILPTDHDESEELIQNINQPTSTAPSTQVPSKPTVPVPNMPAMPTKTQGQGARSTSKQLQETVDNYEELRLAVPPGVRSLEWGANSGIRVMAKSGHGSDIAKGGMLLKHFGTMEDGILVGITRSNKLYIRVPPELRTAEWDPNTEDIRISAHHGRWKPSNY